ncbi:MAG TPA: DUF3592 domain-containing protein [Flavobacteriales bacterium]
MTGPLLLCGGLALALFGLFRYFQTKQEPQLMLVLIGGILAFISVPWLERMDRTNWPAPLMWVYHNAWLLCTIAVSAWTLFQFFRNLGTLTWPGVEGRITRSEAVFMGLHNSKEKCGQSRYAWRVSYTYTVDGQAYSGSRKAMEIDEDDLDLSTAENAVRAHPVGSAVRVYHDPKEPGRACIERGIVNGRWLVPGVIAVLLIIGLYARD